MIVPEASQMEAQIVCFGIARYMEGTIVRCMMFVVPFRAKSPSIHFSGMKLLVATVTAGSSPASSSRGRVITWVVC